MLTLCTHDIMIFGGMKGKLASENFFWKWILLVEEENNEMSVPNSRDKTTIEKKKKKKIKGRHVSFTSFNLGV